MEPFLAVLNYHGFGEYDWLEEQKPYVLDQNVFARQLDLIREYHLQTLSLSGAGEWLYGRSGGRPAVVLTFDDGLLGHFELTAPLLKEKNMRGLFFIPAGLVGKKGMMSWSQLKELVKMGFDVGAHGWRHVPLTDLAPAELEQEFVRSKDVLEERLGYAVDSFSIPRGFYRESFRALAQKAGYRFMFTSRFDFNYALENPFYLKRLAIKRNTPEKDFEGLALGNLGNAKRIETIKERLRGSLSPAFYDRLAAAKRLWNANHG